MKIAIYGGYGYQGRLVLAELARHDAEITLVGRNAARLAAVARGRETRTAAATDHDALVGAFRGANAVINCAGPFTPAGAAVARAAIAAGCHYIDTSGEQLHIKRIYETCSADAHRAGVIVTPAMTDGGVPGDLLARVLADRLGGGPLHEVLTGHSVTGGGGMSRGSMRSLLGTVDVVKSGGLAYEDGEWRTDARPRLASLAFPGRGPVPVSRFALPEVVSVPRHIRAGHVQGFVEADLAARFSGAVPDDAVDAFPEGPDADARQRQRWAVVVTATTPDGRRATGSAEGPDTYGTTAAIAAEGAFRLAGTPGVRAPAEVLPPAAFLDALAPHGITWRTS
ncbi:saccharopine dehydrogenase NADP-binding domain-containing protein [Actinomadura sp. 7K507]|uniref:saccharopine dehydrogenase NADP-binding domain-containing protein n=1 Tax=Actinomadura sp. 7K507 TaxID=2530365 RepID=UPI001045D17E|nr:saccharopine dehydrogenase NADP-binding domain-containing protein [Actinomadura sp. 7K507]TDC73088.1 saccharopine dehydrogenase [Actinomadura sp. 7K507]